VNEQKLDYKDDGQRLESRYLHSTGCLRLVTLVTMALSAGSERSLRHYLSIISISSKDILYTPQFFCLSTTTISESDMIEQTALHKPFLTSKFFEHLYDDDIPKYGENSEIMRRLYGSYESGHSSTKIGIQGHSECCSDKADPSSHSLITDDGFSQHSPDVGAKAAEKSRLPIRSAFSKMKNTLKKMNGSGPVYSELGLSQCSNEDRVMSRAGSLRVRMPRNVSHKWSKSVAT